MLHSLLMGKEMLKHASIVISLCLAALYMLGSAYYRGYLGAVGLVESQFPMRTDQIFATGVVPIAKFGAHSILYCLLAALLFALATTLYQTLNSFNGVEANGNTIEKSAQQVKAKTNKVMLFASRLVFVFFAALFLFVIALVSLSLSSAVGAKYAESKVIYLNKQNSFIQLKGSKDRLKASVFECNTSQCAYVSEGKIIILNRSDVMEVTNEKPKALDK